MTYYIKIFGCQMNYSDAERISTILIKYKFKRTASIDEAGFVIFVTCGVRQSAEDRVYGQINNIRKKYPKKKTVLTGCLAHRKDVQRRLKGKVNLFCEIKNFPKEIKKILNTKYQIRDTKNKPYNDYLQATPKYTNTYTAYIPIMTGCNNFCSYCVVPYARGREYSRPADDILKEVKSLVKKGCKEIILLGQNVNSYCSKFQISNFKFQIKSKLPITNCKLRKFINFSDLLKLIDAVPGRFWLTFLTSHPKDMSNELIETIAKSSKICEYVSLPAQSGDDEILRKMNRKYTVVHYKNLIKKIRATYKAVRPHSSSAARSDRFWQPEPAISTDIIVGFPGETRKQFENTAKLLREMKFDMAYISQYSPRPETTAWKLKDNVGKYEKPRREKVLTEILSKTALANNKKYIGKTVEVLVNKAVRPHSSSAARSNRLKYLAHTRTQKKVIISVLSASLFGRAVGPLKVGQFAKVRITKAKAFGLEGEMN